MKKIKFIAILFALGFTVSVDVNGYEEDFQDDWNTYVFFQFTEHHEDGALERWTGCVTLGGSCWSEGPSIVADCRLPGNSGWTPCNSVE